jgi:Methyltransferase domain
MRARLTLEEALSESHRRCNPSLRNPNWLVLRQRRRIFEERIKSLPSTGIAVLDVGGRLQPYRALIADRIKCYVAVDPQSTPLVNVAAVGEALPFRDGQFDLVISTQVLEYFPDPALAVEEFRRVLKKGGIAFISAPAVALRDNEKEYWRFLPAGL